MFSCVKNEEVVHVIMESQCVASDTSDSTFQYRTTEYIKEILNNQQAVASYKFCDYHTSGADNGIQIISGRRRRATKVSDTKYLVQIKNTTSLASGKVMFGIAVLDSAAAFAAVKADSVCKMFTSAQDVRCVGSTDCPNLSKFGFKCGVPQYTQTLSKLPNFKTKF